MELDTSKGLTPDQLKDFIKEHAGSAFAELMKEHDAHGREAIEKGIEGRIMGYFAKRDSYGGRRDGNNALYSENEVRGLKLARAFRFVAAAKGNKAQAAEISKASEAGAGEEVPYAAEVTKALSAGAAGAGAEFMPPNFVREVIELLRPATVCRSLGARTITMPNGVMSVAKQTGTAAASYVGENTGAAATKASTGNINLVAKKLRITVAISNDMVRYSGIDADAFVRDDMVQSVRVKEDATFLRSKGGEHAPKGLRYWAAAANVLDANATVNLDNVTTDLGRAILALEEANIPFTKPAWIFAPRSRHFLMTLRDGLGNYVYRPEMLAGTLWGFPWRSTTQIPRNIDNSDGAGATESEVFLVEFNEVIIGDVNDLEIVASQEAAYKDENNDLVSAFDLDQTVMRGIARHDLGVRREEAIAILQKVKWGTA